ncbi:autotransporter secretion inner membrane protein TamB [Desulfofustis glycolicus DSM 9705]|uniref:Autotransporter secretion inner membrane protein TamB n=2 Tax=Desulfofustis glycolicus TaxID=51195 RepID=A0A1M5T4U8_9BACT|nr:autotransporter secretion inner membrane protein TamB [Desulfofustis glycolicus DSM 9705]
MVIAGGVVCLVLLALVAALLFSNAGLSTTVRLVSGLSGGGVVIGESHGRLAGAWRLENVVVEMSGGRITIGELACRWQPRKLLRGTLSIGALTARQVMVTVADTEQGETETAPVKGPGELPSLSLPFAILLGSLEVNELSVRDEAGGELFPLIRMSAGLALEHGQLNLTEMRLQTADFQLDLAGSVRSTGDWPLNLDGSWSAALPGCHQLQGTAVVDGSVAAAEILLQLEQPQAVTMNTTLTGLPGQPSWQVQAGGRQLDPAAICPAWPAATLDLSLAASGSNTDYRGDIAITAAAPDLPAVSVTLPVSGTLAGLILEHGRFEGVGGSGRLDGRLSWRDELSWQLELDGSGFDPGSFNPSLAGPLDLTVRADGRVGDAGLSWQAELVALHYQSEFIDEPLTGRALLTGSTTGLDGDVQFTAGGSSVSARAAVGWIDGVDWDGRVVLDAFDPSLLDDLPGGAIDATIASRGRSGGQHLEVESTVERLSGRLAGYQIAGGGGLTYRDGRLLVNDLQVQNGANRLVIDGTVDDRLDLKIVVDGAELERLYEPLRGDVALSGRLSGTRSAPVVDGRLTATSLAYRGYGLQSGSGTIRFGHDGPETIDVGVQVRELTGDGLTVERGGLQVVGSRGDHRVDLDLRAAAGHLRVMLTGALSEQWRWAGTLHEAGFVSEMYGEWQQRGTAACLFGADQVEVDGLCIASGASSLCSDGAWHSAGDWSVDLSSLRLALGDLHGWGVANSPLAGTVEGNLSLGGEGILLRHAAGMFSAAELSINVGEGGWYPELRWNDSRLDVKLVDQRLTAGLSSRFSDASLLTARLAINEMTGFDADFRRLPVSGWLRLDDVAPDPLAPLTDDYLLPSGRLTADLNIGGELGRPWLSGRVVLEDGQIGFPELGIALSDLQGTVHGRGERLTVELRGRSGDGTAHGSGEMSFPGSGWSGNFRISGDKCLLVDQSELMIVASPQVELAIGPDGGSLNGRVLVPEALVQPEEMRGSVSPSSDVVFEDQNEESSAWPFRFTVDVELGEKVRVEGYGVDAELTGGLVVSDTPEQGVTGRGELVVADGTFALYGQPLQISRGRLVFSGAMIDNPDLDIVARKTVQGAAFGSDGAVVGVKVTGSAQDYHLELFSQPTMAENDIVAYLLLDKPIAAGDDSSRGIVNEAISAVGLAAGNDILGDISGFLPIDDLHLEGSADQGGASLVLGKRLTDDLSISYDFNLFEHAAAFRVRYEFGRGFSVQSRNSIESNGVELLYSFER